MLDTKELEKDLKHIYKNRASLLYRKNSKDLNVMEKNLLLNDMLHFLLSRYRVDVNQFVKEFGVIFNDEIYEVQEWLNNQKIEEFINK